jgi:ribosomal protein S10
MTIVTRLTLRSGDRAALDGVVDDVREAARRKGAEMKGPHSEPPEEHRVAQPKRLTGEGGGTFPPWNYTVYTRRIEIRGHEGFARGLLDWDFPDSVHVEVEIDRVRAAGR